MRSVALVLALPLLLPAAPAPQARAKTLPEVTAGTYVLTWAGHPWTFALGPDGSCRCWCGTTQEWYGSWAWVSSTRLLTVRETFDAGQTWLTWTATLDASLAGKAVRNDGVGTGVELRRMGR